MRGLRPADSADRISSCAILMAGLVGGVLVFVVALPLALSSPFPTPKQGEWIIATSSFDGATPVSPPMVPPPMEALPATVLPAAMVGEVVVDPPVAADAASDPAAQSQPGAEPESDITAASKSQMAFAARWDLTVPVRTEAPRIEVPAEATRLAPTPNVAVAAPPKHHDTAAVDPVEEYLWEVYQRKSTKSDSSGDFTWKDPAAAKRRGLSLQAYVIGGMDPDFREQLYHAGHAMDAGGIRWSMLSAFRDDYRQALASGFKAHGGNSQHGGSNATGGYGHGRAIDITTAEGDASAVWHWIDTHGAKFGLRRPMPGADPAHIQPNNAFHNLAGQLREARLRLDRELNVAGAEPAAAKTKVAARADEPNEGRHHHR
jgi:hypothetical protein